MKRNAMISIVLLMFCVVCVFGCTAKPESANSKEAINKSMTMASAEEKVQYLVKEANAYINSEQFDEAIKIARHILAKVDQDSEEAKSILEKAQAELKAMAEKKAEELKAKMKESLGQ